MAMVRKASRPSLRPRPRRLHHAGGAETIRERRLPSARGCALPNVHRFPNGFFMVELGCAILHVDHLRHGWFGCHQGGFRLSAAAFAARRCFRCRHRRRDVFFSRATERRTKRVLRNLDRSFARHGAVRHAGKDVDLESDCTCIGIDVSGGRFLSRSAASVQKILSCLHHLCTLPAPRQLSPRQLSAVLGSMQWHCQLNRPYFSICHEVYAFTKILPEDKLIALPPEC